MSERRFRLAGWLFVGIAADLATPAALAAPADQRGDQTVETIIVTATKRPEPLATIPLAISDIAGETLRQQRVQSLQDLVIRIPSAAASDARGGVGGSFPYIRGSGASDDSAGAEQSVVIIQDGLYYGTALSFNPDYFDVARVDVLRGPQGTSYGKNAVGGAILVESAAPGFDRAAQISASVANFGAFDTEGFANGALTDELAGRVSFSYKESDGHVRNDFTGNQLEGKDVVSGRGQLLWRPADDLSLRAIASFSRNRNTGAAFTTLYDSSTNIILPPGIPAPPNKDAYHVTQSVDGYTRIDLFNAGVHLNWDTRLGTVTNVVGYHSTDAKVGYDFDGVALPVLDGSGMHPNIRQDEHQWSEEIRIASSGGKYLDYLLGAYYLHGSISRWKENFGTLTPGTFIHPLQMAVIGTPSFNVMSHQKITDEYVAAYGELIFYPWDRIHLRAAARYAHEKKTGSTDHFGSPRLVTDIPTYHAPLNASFDAFTPKLTLEFKPDDWTVFYGSFAKGYKSGGFNQDTSVNPSASCDLTCATNRSIVAAQRSFDPEKNSTWELGYKGQWFDNKVHTALTLYHSTTRELQVRSFDPALLAVVVGNAGEARARGVELEVDARPTDQLSVGFMLSYADAEFTDLSISTCASCTGNAIPFTPKWLFSPYAKYTFGLGDAGTLTIHGEHQRRSSYYWDITNPAFGKDLTEKTKTVNLRATWESTDGLWEVSAWSNNLLNEHAVETEAFGFAALVSANPAANYALARLQAPRTYGVTATRRWR